MRLSTRIFALAFANLVLLAAVFLAFAHYQFHLNFRSLLVAPAEDRVGQVARAVASDLTQTPQANRTALMGRYAATYKADFYLFDNNATQLAGKPVQLPSEVKRELTRRPPDAPPVGREPPPPARQDAPPPVDDRPRPGPPPPPREDFPPPPEDGTLPPPPPGRGSEGRGFRPPPPQEDQQGPGARDDSGTRPLPPRRPPPRRRPELSVAAGASGAAAAPKLTAIELLANVTNARYQTSQLSEGGLYWVMTRVPVVDPGEGSVVRGTLFMVAGSFRGTPLFLDFKPWLAAFAAAIAIFLLCWLPFIRGLSRAISRLTVNTGRIAEGDFENHLPENRSDEIGQLSVSINRMAGRLSGFVTGQKRFLGDIAHELSAPIARVQFALGILDQRAREDQREAVDDLREEIGQMSGLVGELLSFSKAGLEAGSTTLKAIDAMPLVRQAVARESGGGQVVVIESEPVFAMAEQNLLLRAVANLVRNAVRYAGADGPITVSVKRVDAAVLITVADSGPGLPAVELDRVFAPFYRPDTSRTRDTGGAGLGLAIVKSCIDASGGTVQCRNRDPHGLEVEIRLKAATI